MRTKEKHREIQFYGLRNTLDRGKCLTDGFMRYKKVCYGCGSVYESGVITSLTCSDSCKQMVRRLRKNGVRLEVLEPKGDFTASWERESVEGSGDLEGLNSLNHQEFIRDMMLNINFYLHDKRINGESGGYVLSEMPLIYHDSITKRYRIPDLTVFDDQDNPYTVIEIYDKGKQAQAKKVYEDIRGKIQWFYYYEITNNLLMKATINKKGETDFEMTEDVELPNGKMAKDKLLEHSKAILPNMWEAIDGLDKRIGNLENRFDGLENRIDGLENRIDGLDSKMTRIEDLLQKLLEK